MNNKSKAHLIREIIDATKRRRPGCDVQVKENTGSISPNRRAALREESAASRQLIAELRATRSNLVGHYQRLLCAAQFVCDVNGDQPSIEQLRKAVADSTADTEAEEQIATLLSIDRERGSLLARKRWEVHCDNGMYRAITDGADTIEELHRMTCTSSIATKES